MIIIRYKLTRKLGCILSDDMFVLSQVRMLRLRCTVSGVGATAIQCVVWNLWVVPSAVGHCGLYP